MNENKTNNDQEYDSVFTKYWRGLWIVEWNEKQKCFHVEEADMRLTDSIRAFLDGRSRGEWVTIGVFNSYSECSTFTDWLRSVRPEICR